MSSQALTLPDAGFRFTFKTDGGWNWRLEVEPGDVDATDMTPEQFEEAVRAAT